MEKNKEFNMKYLLSIFIISSLFFTGQSSAFAQSVTPSPSPSPKLKVLVKPQGAINMTISPTYVNLTTDPGKEVSSQFSVTNNNAFIEYYKVSLVRYEVSQGGNGLSLRTVESNDSFAKWITFSENEFSVDTNQNKTVKFSIKPTPDAALGYYYGIMISRLDENTTNGRSSVTGAPVFSVLLEVRTPNAKRELQLVDFSTDSLVYEYLPATFNVQLKNTGNIHSIPAGDIFIDHGKKKDVAIIPMNPGRGNVLPQAQRTFTVDWSDAFVVRGPKLENGKTIKDAKGNPVLTTKYDLTKADKFRFGKYTAHVLMVYDNGERDVPLEGTVSFWVLPWKMLAAGGVIILLILLGLRSTILSIFKRK